MKLNTYQIQLLKQIGQKPNWMNLKTYNKYNKKMYRTFKRTWWIQNPEWPNSLEPGAGEKHNFKTWETEEEARNYCKKMNGNPKNFPNPNTYSMKYEYEKL